MVWGGVVGGVLRVVRVGIALLCAWQAAACGSGQTTSVPLHVPPRVASLDAFDETMLHYVDLEVAEEHLATLVPGVDERVPARLVFDHEVLDDIGLRLKRGQGSMQPLEGKPGFQIKTNEFVKGRALHGVKKFTLNNAIQDRTYLSEHVAYDIWRRAGVPGRRTSLARVTFNGSYLGVYVVAEAYDSGPVERAFAWGGNLYEGVPGVDLVDPDGLDLETNEDENDRSDLFALAAVLETEPDHTFAEALDFHLDVEAFLTYWAVEALVVHWDSFAGQNHGLDGEPSFLPNNWYAYRDPLAGRLYFLPHGADQCFVRPVEAAPLYAPPSPRSLLPSRCMENAELRARYFERALAVLDSAWDVDVLLERVERAVALIEASVLEGDRFRWQSRSEYRAALDDLARFLRERPDRVRAQLAAFVPTGAP